MEQQKNYKIGDVIEAVSKVEGNQTIVTGKIIDIEKAMDHDVLVINSGDNFLRYVSRECFTILKTRY